MEGMKSSLGLIHDVLQDEWVLELVSSFSSTSTNPSSNYSNAPTTPSIYESCPRDDDDSPMSSPLPSPMQSSLPSWYTNINNNHNNKTSNKKTKTNNNNNNNNNSPSKGKKSSKSCMVPYLVQLVMRHGQGKLWNVVKSGCMACIKPNFNKNKKNNKLKGICGDVNVANHVHKRKGSAEFREEDLKEAIKFCNRSAATS